MLIDAGALLSYGQAITGDAVSTDALDLGSGGLDRGPGGGLVVAIHIAQSFALLTSLAIQLQCDTDSNFGSPRTLTQLSLTLAELTAGRLFTLPLPLERVERYVRLNYSVTGTNPNAGKISAWFTSAT